MSRRPRAWWNRHPPVAQPGAVTPGALWFLRWVLHPIVRVLHRATLEGVEHLPPAGTPYLLVANHPSGIGPGEFLCFAALYARAFPGAPPPLAAFVLALSFSWWPFSWFFGQIGAIPSTYGAGLDALRKGVPFLVFPGGDVEAMRPFWRHDRADFSGRKGFLRIAREAGVPIVPMRIQGVTAPILVSSPLLAWLAIWPRALGLKRATVSVLTVLGIALIAWLAPIAWPWRVVLAWAWFASPLTLASWLPVRVRIRIGAPIAADGAELETTLHLVESTITDLEPG